MKNFLITGVLLVLTGCSVQPALITAEPEGNEYHMFFDRSEVLKGIDVKASLAQRAKIYEERVNLILEKDPNTSSCKVTAGSVQFGEPGSTGSAIVFCTNLLPLEKSGMFTETGKPFYKYGLSNADGI